jgi:hypothetical protein
MKNEKITVVERMVKNGYCLFGETVEHFANRFDLAILLHFEKTFNNFKKN